MTLEEILQEIKTGIDDRYSLTAVDTSSLKIIIDYVENESIPKEKVEKKIDEIEKAYEDSKDENEESEYYYPDYTINILQELLGE